MPKNISVIGAGYVGLITGAGLAEEGHNVVCVDIVKETVDTINSGRSHIYEKGLNRLLGKNMGKRLKATTDFKNAVQDSDISFICVGTPSGNDGSIDLKYIEDVSRNIGEILSKSEKKYHVVVIKSTVVPGTTEEFIIPLLESSGKKAGRDFGVVMNPEFLREGIAIEDFFNPDRIVIGSIDTKSGDLVEELYSRLECPVLRTDLKTAEMIKYASNSFLATKLSFINEIGNICKELDIDVDCIAKGIGMDHRISPHFLKAGPGFGGSCLPKDVRALIYRAREAGYNPELLNTVLDINREQPMRLLNIAREKIKGFDKKRVAVLGLAFKPDTDDMRDSPSIPIINELLKENAVVIAYDPKAEKNSRKIFDQGILYSDSAKDALKDADIAIIVTDWAEFSDLDFSGMKQKIVIDGRNIVKDREGIVYEGLY